MMLVKNVSWHIENVYYVVDIILTPWKFRGQKYVTEIFRFWEVGRSITRSSPT